MKIFFMIFIVASMVIVSSCEHNSSRKETILPMENTSETIEFGTEIIILKSAGVNESLNIEAKLINSSNKVFSIMYENQIFEFYIADKKNQRINSFAKKSSGVVDKLEGNSERKQVYSYTIDKKGKYNIWAVARFNIEDKEYEIKTDTLSIEIN